MTGGTNEAISVVDGRSARRGFPVPVVFVCRNPERWPELFDGTPWPPDLDAVPDRVVIHEDLTIVQTAVLLAAAGWDVDLATEPRPDAINVVSGIELRISDRWHDRFVVAFRGDWSRTWLGDLSLAMNRTIATRRSESHMPHWIQTGLQPRNPEREPRVENLVFKGDLVNLAEPFRSGALVAELRRRGVEFRADVWDPRSRRAGWHDYRDVDAVVAVRDIAGAELATKPAAKLVNAWAAGVPAFLGVEPAYRELRTDDLDYFEVTEPEQLLEGIDRLNSDPGLYVRMVEHGRRRAEEFSRARNVQRWVEFLSGPAAEAYRSWAASPAALRPLRFAARAVRQKIENLTFGRRQSTR